jgi:NAD(P)-dependent dehydrogenase (short-subunit alcohol dehydrogenase family)
MPGAPSESPQRTKQLVWFVTGTSSGLGLHLVHHILSSSSFPNSIGNQDRVIATARPRSIHLLDPLLSNPAYEGRLKVLPLDITDSEERIREVVRDAVGVWGRIDVCVNNAGWVVFGSLPSSLLPFPLFPSSLPALPLYRKLNPTLTDPVLPRLSKKASHPSSIVTKRTSSDL